MSAAGVRAFVDRYMPMAPLRLEPPPLGPSDLGV